MLHLRYLATSNMFDEEDFAVEGCERLCSYVRWSLRSNWNSLTKAFGLGFTCSIEPY